MEVSEEQLLNLKRLIHSMDGLSYERLKEIYPNFGITTIENLKEYILNRTKEKEYFQILLVLNSKNEPHGHYIVCDSYGHIFDPLGYAGLINMTNCPSEVKDYLYKFSNMEVIQNIDSQCCGLLCILFVFLNLITMKKNKCFVNVKGFKKIVDCLRSDKPDKNIYNLIYELIMKIKNY